MMASVLHLQITELVFFSFLFSFFEMCWAVEPSATICKAF